MKPSEQIEELRRYYTENLQEDRHHPTENDCQVLNGLSNLRSQLAKAEDRLTFMEKLKTLLEGNPGILYSKDMDEIMDFVKERLH